MQSKDVAPRWLFQHFITFWLEISSVFMAASKSWIFSQCVSPCEHQLREMILIYPGIFTYWGLFPFPSCVTFPVFPQKSHPLNLSPLLLINQFGFCRTEIIKLIKLDLLFPFSLWTLSPQFQPLWPPEGSRSPFLKYSPEYLILYKYWVIFVLIKFYCFLFGCSFSTADATEVHSWSPKVSWFFVFQFL